MYIVRQVVMRMLLGCVVGIMAIGCATPHQFTTEERGYAKRIMEQPTEFKLPKSEADDAWGRANLFLSRYSSMKLQTGTDMLLSTFNPVEIGYYGYEITRSPIKDSVMFSVGCSSFRGNPFSDERTEADQNARAAAYYMRTSEVIPLFVYGRPN
jgi:hypothetical protein